MGRTAMLVMFAHTTGHIDLSYDAFANLFVGVQSLLILDFPTKEFIRLINRYHFPNKFVAEHAC